MLQTENKLNELQLIKDNLDSRIAMLASEIERLNVKVKTKADEIETLK